MFREEREDKFERRSTPTYILPIYYTILFDAKVRELTTKRHTHTRNTQYTQCFRKIIQKKKSATSIRKQPHTHMYWNINHYEFY